MPSNSAQLLERPELYSDPTFHKSPEDGMNIVNIVSSDAASTANMRKGGRIDSINELVEESYEVFEDEAGDDFEAQEKTYEQTQKMLANLQRGPKPFSMGQMRPISAKTNFSHGSNLMQFPLQFSGGALVQGKSTQKMRTSLRSAKMRAIEEFYHYDGTNVKKRSRHISVGRPPKAAQKDRLQISDVSSILGNQSNLSKPDFAVSSFRPIKIVPENLPSQLLLKQSGIKDRKSLFQMIDSNFKDLPHMERTSSMGRFRGQPVVGQQINEAYANEANIQSQIFFYNNSVLNKVVDNLGLKGKRVENLLVRDEANIKNTLYPPANIVDVYSPPKNF